MCRVLGPTTVTDEGTPIDLGGPLPRRLLTALLLAEGTPVPDERLASAVWGEHTPTRPASALQVYVSRLRRALGNSWRGLLARAGTGYVFRLPPTALDVVRFAGAVERGRRLFADGAAAEAERVFADALAWWRGEPYADLLDTTEVTAARARLAELHEVAVEERLAARLSTGDAPGAAAELDAAVRAAPYRERRWALRILALYRCGRQSDALAALRAVRALLADELGIEPGPELQRMERLVLAQDPRLLLPEPRSTPAPVASRRQFGRPLSSFVGRDTELATVGGLLAAHRLVTVTGPAGVGKTRLVVEYAAALPDTDDLWLVRLADARQPEVVAHAVADAVGLAHMAGEPETVLLDALATRSGLLVLDNCEHLVDAVARLAVALLTGCPGLRILATSREQLSIDGEATVAVAPLPVWTGDGADGPATLLLLDRIRAVRPGWQPSAEERRQVHRMCVALDGLPLAIELAATRARVLGLAEIEENLDDRFALLGAVPRGSLAAHATLRAAIAWSVELLSSADRALLLRLWPFEGGFSLEATDAVRPPGPAGRTAVSALESLSTLVSRSVVQADTTVSPSRYRLLETIRSYCRATDPDPDGTREAHAAWVRRIAARAGSDLRGRHSAMAMRTLTRELPNLRAGLAHDLAHRPHEAVRTVGALDWFWGRGGHLTEGRRLMEAALRSAPDAPHVDRARVHVCRVSIAGLAVDEDVIRELIEQALVAVGEPSDEGHDDEHRTLYGNLRYYTALFALSTGDPERALTMADEAVTIGDELGLDWLSVAGLMIRNAAFTRLGRTAEGEDGLLATVELAERTGQLWCAAWSEFALALSYLNRPATHIATLDALRHALRRFRGEHDTLHSLAVLYTGAHALTLAGLPQTAARLRAAVRHHAIRLGTHPDVLRRFASPTVDDIVDGALTPDELRLADGEGASLTWPEMVALLATPTAEPVDLTSTR